MARKPVGRTPSDEIDCERFAQEMPPLPPDEEAMLLASLEVNGVMDPLTVAVVEGKRYLIDGFQRRRLCTKLGLIWQAYVREKEFESLEAVDEWIEAYAGGRRSYTRTMRNYFIGRRYAREKKAHGGQLPRERGGKKVPIPDTTAQAIAAQEGCSDRHVKNCYSMAWLLDLNRGNSLAQSGYPNLKWPILMERLPSNRTFLETLIQAGAGDGREQTILELVAMSEKKVSAETVYEALGIRPVNEKAKSKPAERPADPQELVDQLGLSLERVSTRDDAERLHRRLGVLLNAVSNRIKELSES